MTRWLCLLWIGVCLGLGSGCGGGGGSGKPDVLVIYAAGGDPVGAARAADVVSKLSAPGVFDDVATVDAGAATPTLATLRAFDAVLVYSDFPFADADAIGDVLADYVDEGGRVVLALFSFENDGYAVQGRFASDLYFAIEGSRNSAEGGGPLTLGTVHDPSHPILSGVASFSGGTSSLRPGGPSVETTATRIADWSDGSPLVAVRTIGGTRRADLGFWPPSSDADPGNWDSTTDGDLLLINALLWVAGEI